MVAMVGWLAARARVQGGPTSDSCAGSAGVKSMQVSLLVPLANRSACTLQGSNGRQRAQQVLSSANHHLGLASFSLFGPWLLHKRLEQELNTLRGYVRWPSAVSLAAAAGGRRMGRGGDPPH